MAAVPSVSSAGAAPPPAGEHASVAAAAAALFPVGASVEVALADLGMQGSWYSATVISLAEHGRAADVAALIAGLRR